ncbi:MAG TPA: alpha/beta fold hydrolase [Actinocrinis sp.]|jgi:pimeloyl-ACP methyl ester carboxylesterase
MKVSETSAWRNTVQTAAGEISYLEAGSGRPVLLVHGLGTNAALWRNLIAELRDEYRLLALDLPAHGRSPVPPPDADAPTLTGLAEAVNAFCDALGLAAVDVVSNDTGGAVVQIFASRHPERINTLTLTNCEAHDNLPNELFRGTVELARAGRLVAASAQLLENRALVRSERSLGSNYEDPAYLTDEMIDSYLGPVAGNPQGAAWFQRLLAGLDPAELLGAEPGLRALAAPALIVWGAADLHFEVSWAHFLRGLLPGAVGVVELPGARLHFPDERAVEFAAILRRHLSEHGRRAGT